MSKKDLDSIVESIKARRKVIVVDSASKVVEKLGTPSDTKSDWTRRKLRAILSFQWGPEVSRLSDLDSLNVNISKSTGKMRHVKLGKEIILTLVPTTGLFTATYEGGLQLIEQGLDSKYKVRLDEEVRQFVIDGKSALAKFIGYASPELHAGEEVVVVDSSDTLLGVGKALLSGREMATFQRGVAVNIRHSMKS